MQKAKIQIQHNGDKVVFYNLTYEQPFFITNRNYSDVVKVFPQLADVPHDEVQEWYVSNSDLRKLGINAFPMFKPKNIK